MTEQEYWAKIKELGLTPTNVPNVYFSREKVTHYVENPAGFTTEQIQALFNKILITVTH